MNLGLLLEQSPVIQIHVYAAVAALILGAWLLWGRKGVAAHRIGGWVWVSLMAITAGVSLFITGLNGDHWSAIHALSGFTLITLPLGVFFARRHKVKQHRRTMMGIFFGGSVIAGAFTLVPGRLMWQVFFG